MKPLFFPKQISVSLAGAVILSLCCVSCGEVEHEEVPVPEATPDTPAKFKVGNEHITTPQSTPSAEKTWFNEQVLKSSGSLDAPKPNK